MNNFERSVEATNTAMNSQGSGFRENEQYLKSLEARLNKFKNAWTEFAISAGDAILSDGVIAFSEGMSNLISGGTGAVKTMGLLPPIIGLVSVAIASMNNVMRTSVMEKAKASTATNGLAGAYNRLATSASLAGGATRTLSVILRSVPQIAVFMGIGLAFEKLFSAIMKTNQAQADLNKKLTESANALKNNTKSIDELKTKYKELEEVRNSSGLNIEQEEEYTKIQSELAELLPSVVKGMDSKGNKIIVNSQLLEREIELLERKLELEKQERLTEAPKKLDTMKSDKEDLELKKQGKELALTTLEKQREEAILSQRNAKNDTERILAKREENRLNDLVMKYRNDILSIDSQILSKQLEIDQLYKDMLHSSESLSDSDFEYLKNMDASMSKMQEFSDQIADVRNTVGDIFSAEDISNFTEDQLSRFHVLSNAIKNGETDWEKYRTSLNHVGLDADKIISHIIQKTKEQTDAQTKMQNAINLGLFEDAYGEIPISTIERLNELNEEGAQIYNSLGQAVDEFGKVLDSTNEQKWQAVSASEALFNKTEEQIKQTLEAIQLIQLLSQVETLNANQKQHMANAIAHLESIYPHLTGRIHENIQMLYDEAMFMDEVNKASGRMAEVMSGNADATTKAIVQSVNDRINAYNAEMDALSLLAQERNKLVEVLRNQDDTIGMQTDDMKRYIGLTVQLSEQRAKLVGARDNASNAISGFNSHMDNKGKSGSSSKSNSSSSSQDPAQKDKLDALIRQINAQHQLVALENDQLKSQIEQAKNQSDYNKQLELTNSLISGQQSQVVALRKANEQIHQKANAIRGESKFNTSNWFDNNNQETQEYIDLYNSLSKTEQEVAQNTFNRLQKLKGAFGENSNEISNLIKFIDELTISLPKLSFDANMQSMSRFSTLMEGVDRSIKKSQLTRDQYEEGSADWIKSIQEEVKHLEYKQHLYDREATEIKKLLQNTNLSTEEYNHWTKALSDNTLAQLENMNAIRNNSKTIEQQMKQFANQIIDTYKDVYRKQLRIVQEGIKNQLDELEKAHKRKIDMLDEEMKKFEDVVNAQIRAIDDEESEDDFQKRLTELQDDELKLRQEINAKSLDDSVENKANLIKLEEDLQKKIQEIEALKKKRSTDLRKQNLRDELEAKRTEIQYEKDAAQQKHDIERKRLDDERLMWERHYENLIEDEERWHNLREELMSGHVGNLINEFERMKNEIEPHMEAMGESITKNLLNKISEAQALMSGMSNSNLSSPTSLSPSTSSDTQSNSLSIWGHDYKVDANGNVYKNGQYIPAENFKHIPEEVLEMARKAKLNKYHSGGIVGDKAPSKIAEIANKMFNASPNEQVIKSLLGELQIPPQNMSKYFIPNTQRLINSAMSKVGGGSNIVIEKLLQIDKIENGTNLDIERLVDQVNDKFVQKLRTYGLLR